MRLLMERFMWLYLSTRTAFHLDGICAKTKATLIHITYIWLCNLAKISDLPVKVGKNREIFRSQGKLCWKIEILTHIFKKKIQKCHKNYFVSFWGSVWSFQDQEISHWSEIQWTTLKKLTQSHFSRHFAFLFEKNCKMSLKMNFKWFQWSNVKFSCPRKLPLIKNLVNDPQKLSQSHFTWNFVILFAKKS